jgi:ubiquinone/menaquinone biosynthesis C-methylase UbiE
VKRRLVAGAGIAAAVAAWWLTDSAPYPYGQRALLDLPLPFLTNRRLDALLGARPGERVLEIGSGTGLQSLHVARQLGPSGRLDIIDVQPEMLDCVMRRAAARGIGEVVPTRADARELPFPDATFDAAYMVTALGEIPDRVAALRELRRVLKPAGRLVVGEFFDRHYVPLVTLLRHAGASGFQPGMSIGPPFAYLARLEPAVSQRTGSAPDHATG